VRAFLDFAAPRLKERLSQIEHLTGEEA
jgi:hypothetical protein